MKMRMLRRISCMFLTLVLLLSGLGCLADSDLKFFKTPLMDGMEKTASEWTESAFMREEFVVCAMYDFVNNAPEDASRTFIDAALEGAIYVAKTDDLLNILIYVGDKNINFFYMPGIPDSAAYALHDSPNSFAISAQVVQGMKDKGTIDTYWKVDNNAVLDMIYTIFGSED